MANNKMKYGNVIFMLTEQNQFQRKNGKGSYGKWRKTMVHREVKGKRRYMRASVICVALRCSCFVQYGYLKFGSLIGQRKVVI